MYTDRVFGTAESVLLIEVFKSQGILIKGVPLYTACTLEEGNSWKISATHTPAGSVWSYTAAKYIFSGSSDARYSCSHALDRVTLVRNCCREEELDCPVLPEESPRIWSLGILRVREGGETSLGPDGGNTSSLLH